MKTSEVIRGAIDTINRRGWTTGEWGVFGYESVASRVCLEGAIAAAVGLEEKTREIYASEEDVPDNCGTWGEWLSREIKVCPAAKAVRDYLGIGEQFLSGWNDAPIGYEFEAELPHVNEGKVTVAGAKPIYHTQEDILAVLEEVAKIEEEKEAAEEAVLAAAAEVLLVPEPEEDEELVPV